MFFISQPLLRFPLLNWLQGRTEFVAWTISYPTMSMVFLALSAGVFEEVFRYIFKQFLIRQEIRVFTANTFWSWAWLYGGSSVIHPQY